MKDIKIVCGSNWGDEGKGRVIDLLAENADLFKWWCSERTYRNDS